MLTKRQLRKTYCHNGKIGKKDPQFGYHFKKINPSRLSLEHHSSEKSIVWGNKNIILNIQSRNGLICKVFCSKSWIPTYLKINLA